MAKDHCTWFPEKWRGVDISGCCKVHDDSCSTSKFYTCLRGRINKIPAFFIAVGGGTGCWFKYTSKMFKKAFRWIWRK